MHNVFHRPITNNLNLNRCSYVNLRVQFCQSKGKKLTLMAQDDLKMAGGCQVTRPVL